MKEPPPPDAMRQHWRLALRIGVTLLSVGLLCAVAIPDFSSRPRSPYNAIVNNLRVIDNQKQLWAADCKKSDDDTPSADDLAPYFGDGRFPKSVLGETYNINNVRTRPTATLRSRLNTPRMTIEAGSTVAIPDP
ncbi:MAG: hypothetical protein JNL10_22455 [Verrucomicrobiales bacterium]|nr:hypothetical protein [Verrucomicrobiales bacterium]